MAKVTKPSDVAKRLKRDIQTKADMQRILNPRVMQEIADVTVEEMLAGIAEGKSPIAGKGNFPAYKNPKKYPGKRKPARPVNLELTGQMLSSLRYRINQAKLTITLFYAGAKAKKKELGHREGANGQPRRPSLPLDNENLNARIAKRIREVIAKALRQASQALRS